MTLELKWVENVQSLVAGLHEGRAAARIFVCSQQKPWTEQVESFSCIFKNFIRICIFSHPVNFGVWKEWQFLQHFHGQVRLLVVIPTSFFTQKKGANQRLIWRICIANIFNDLNKVTFDDETPERPPPPPPARLESINTMKDFSGVSQAYNQV